MRRRASLVGLVSLALAGVVLASPSGRAATGPHAHDVARATVVSGVHRYRLITGDTVRVLTRDDGMTIPVVEGHVPYARFGTAAARYALPRTPGSELRRLDLSLFDTTALAAASRAGRVPVVIRLAGDASLQRVPGLRVGGASAVERGTVVHASYGPHFAGLSARDLRHVSGIRLAQAAPRLGVTGPTHQVTVHVRTAHGRPSQDAIVLVENVDDLSSYLETLQVDSTGSVQVDVPEGDYAVGAFTFSRVTMVPEVHVDVDTSVNLDLGEATVKPHVSMPGHRVLDTALAIDRAPDSGFPFPLGFYGPHFFTRVQPAGGQVQHGALQTGVSAVLAKNGPRDPTAYHDLVVTAHISKGIPADLTYRRHRRDLARMVDRLYATGPANVRRMLLSPADYPGDLFMDQEYPVRVPGRLTVLAEPGHYYQQSLVPTATPSHDSIHWLIGLNRSGKAGSTRTVSFAHGPVGPGSERPRAGFGEVVRRQGRLEGYLPLLSGAGSSMISSMGRRAGDWSLRRSGHTLAHGHGDITLDVPLPKSDHRYVLTATSHPRSRQWTLSTKVRDTWVFHSSDASRDVPLLTPSYVPPTSLDSSLPPGPISFSLSFVSPSTRHHRITSAHMQASSNNGRTWRSVRLTRLSATAFQVRYRSPSPERGQRYLSFRVSGRDAQGDQVTETALHAYRLR